MTNFKTMREVSVAVAMLLTATTNAWAAHWQYQYDGYGRVLSIDGPRNDVTDVTSFTYGDRGEILSLTTAAGHLWSWGDYNADLLPGYVTDPSGISTHFTYDTRRRLRASLRDNPEGAAYRTSYEYDTTGRLTAVVFPDGLRTHYEYDAAGRLIAMANGSGDRLEFELDLAGNRVRELIRDSSGQVHRSLTRQFDELSRQLRSQDAEGEAYTTTYDTSGRPVIQTDGRGNSTVLTYDAFGRLDVEIAPLGHSISFTYDQYDEVSSIADPRDLITFYDNDALGRLESLHSPDTGLTSFEYDDAGNRIAAQDAKGNVVRWQYDALNRTTLVDYDNDSLDIRLAYDVGEFGQGRLASVEDESSALSYRYDSVGNVRQVALDYHGATPELGYTWQEGRRLTGLLYPSGNSLQYQYSPDGKLVAMHWYSPTSGAREIASNIDHMPLGPWRGMTLGNGVHAEQVYNQDFQLISQTFGGIASADYLYDANGNVISRNQSDFQYDEIDRLSGASASAGDISIEYDAAGNRLAYTIKRNDIRYQYDANSHRLLRSDDWEYQYDEVGNLIEKTSRDGSAGKYFFSHDDRGRLIEVHRKYSVTSGKGRNQMIEERSETTTYRYNGLGQRIAKFTDDALRWFVYGLQGELLAELNEEGEAIKEHIYLEGRPIAVVVYGVVADESKGEEVLLIDQEDVATNTAGTWILQKSSKSYGRDYRLSDDSLGVFTWQLAGLEPGRYEVFSRWPGSNKHSTASVFSVHHEHGVDTSVRDQTRGVTEWQSLGVYELSGNGADSVELSGQSGRYAADAIRVVAIPPVEEHSDGKVYYVHADHLGTPNLVIDDAQNIVWQALHQPFGEAELSTESIEYNLRFPGQYYDAETGLHYNYFRDYDPGLGRYIQSDPIGLNGGLNTYAYAFDNPVRFTDASGLFPVPAFVAVCLASPVCAAAVATAARSTAGAAIGGLSALNELLSDPCFGGEYLLPVISGTLFGGVSGALPGAGSIVTAATRGAVAGGLGNASGQVARKDSLTSFDPKSAAIAATSGAVASVAGNVTGLARSLSSYRSGASVSIALARGASEGSAISSLVNFAAGSLGTLTRSSNSDCGCGQ